MTRALPPIDGKPHVCTAQRHIQRLRFRVRHPQGLLPLGAAAQRRHHGSGHGVQGHAQTLELLQQGQGESPGAGEAMAFHKG